MTFALAPRVQETTTSTSTLSVGATVNLAGASTQYQSFVTGIGNGNTCYATFISGNGTDWQDALCTVTGGSPNTLTINTILSTSSGGSAITLSGTSTVFGSVPANMLKAMAAGFPPDTAGVLFPPSQANSGFSTWSNQGSCTETDTSTGMYFNCPSNSTSSKLRYLYKTAPATPYSLSFALNIAYSGNAAVAFGFSDGTKSIVLETEQPANSTAAYVYEWTNDNTGGSQMATVTWPVYGLTYVKLRDDGTSIYFYLSNDGVNWQLIYSQARASYLSSPSRVILGANPYATATMFTISGIVQGIS